MAIKLALSHGRHVIFEGNFRLLADDGLPLPLLHFEGAEVHAFYLDVSLPETLRRHASRTDRRITAERMVELYPAAHPIEALNEVILAERLTVEAAVETIRTVSQI